MTAEQKRQHWLAHVNCWKKTELLQNAYCREHNLSNSSFSCWLKRLNEAATHQPPSKFIPLKVIADQVVTLKIADVSIALSISALEQVLPVVLRAVREAS